MIKKKKQNLNKLKQLKFNESTPIQEIGNHSLHFILYHGFENK
jgi:cytolysin (calcineurin-like family phosphatase)